MSTIAVIGFVDEEGETKFIRRISDATLNTLLAMHAAPGHDLSPAVIHVCRLRSPRQQLGPQARDYRAVYALNEAAVAMCEDLGMSLKIIGGMDEMPDEVSYDLEAHYLPKPIPPTAG